MKTTVSRRGLFFGLGLLIVFTIAAPGVTLGSTIYVDDDNVGGPWDGSAEYPFRFIQDGVDHAVTRDTVYVRNGTYYELVVVETTLKLIGENKDSTILDAKTLGTPLHIKAPWVVVTGFTIKRGGYEGVTAGICVQHTNVRIVNNNVVDNLGYGIYLGGAGSSILWKNTITTAACGVFLNGSTFCYLLENDIVSNDVGIHVNSTSCILYHNNLVSNDESAIDLYNNTWDNGYPSGGNYWSDFDEASEGAFDNDGDGIVDSPYQISDGASQDQYPLISPWEGRILSDTVYVDDDYGSHTAGWQLDRFHKIRDGLDAAAENGVVVVYEGAYTEPIWVGRTAAIVGEGPDITTIDGNNRSAHGIYVTADGASITGLTVYDFNGTGVILASNNAYLCGNKINVDNHSNDAVALVCASGATICDNTIWYCDIGISAWESMNNVMFNNTISDAPAGIHLSRSSGNQVFENECASNGVGIALYDSSGGNTVTGNVLSWNDFGVRITGGSDGNVLYHNQFVDNDQNAYDECISTWDNGYPSGGNTWSDFDEMLEGAFDYYSGESQDEPGSDGIVDSAYTVPGGTNQDRYPFINPEAGPLEVFVDDDFDEATPGWGVTHFAAILAAFEVVKDSGTVNIYSGTYHENLVLEKTLALVGEDSSTTIVDGGATGDVVLVNRDGVTITGLTLRNAGFMGDGIRVNSGGCTISSNIIQANGGSGIHLASTGCDISRNVISANGGSGIVLESSASDNVISDNNITDNGSYGIYSTGAWNNVIYHNNFVGNGQNAYDSGDNQWDSGYPEFGNYWSDYVGGDDWHGPFQINPGGDGIGDEPYLVPGDQSRDRFPLLSPWDGTLPVPPTPQFVYVDDDFDESDLGWGYCLFRKIQDAIDAVDTLGTVSVRAGIYTRGFYIDKKIAVIGDDPDNILVSDYARQGCIGWTGAAVAVHANGVQVSGFTFEGFHGFQPSYTACVCSDSNTFTGNKFVSTLTGLWTYDSHHNSIVDNVFTCPTGLRLEESNDNDVTGNMFQGCDWGLDFYISYDNNVVGNTFTDNTGFGVVAGLSAGAMIYHNNFLGNGTNAAGGFGSNTWDNGYPSGGNFWDDYTGSDEFSGPDQDIPGSDGIGDTPYTTERLTDNYPLMAPITLEGDANGDDVVNVGDVIFLINYLYRDGTPPSPPSAGDCNCDGQVNLADVVYLINYLYRGGPPPGC